MKAKTLLSILALAVAGTASAQMKPEDAIKWRQSGYAFMAWNMSRIKANVEGTYNKEEVMKAANAIQAIANSGMGALYLRGEVGPLLPWLRQSPAGQLSAAQADRARWHWQRPACRPSRSSPRPR